VSTTDQEEAQSTTQAVIKALSDLEIDESKASEETVDLEAELMRAEADLGSTDRAKQANSCMLSLARASRSYLIYDPRNNVIRKFLLKVQTSFELYTRKFGDMELQVRPFELVLDDEVIYLERDWERSLAFKLFRDGVRRVIIQSGVTWEELTRLLEILSIRFVGVRLQEDDILTLLWKASFENIQIEAVEGFVPLDDEDQAQAGASGAALAGLGVVSGTDGAGALRAPRDFDLPPPELPEGVETFLRPVDDAALTRLQAEYLGTHVAKEVLSLCKELMGAAADPVDMMSFDDLNHFLRETREFLLSEDDLEQLIALSRLLKDYSNTAGLLEDDRDALNRLMEGFTNERAMRKLLGSIDRNANEPPEFIYQLLALHPTDPLPSLFDVLDVERLGQPRRMARMLVENYLPERTDAVVARYRKSSDDIAADLLRVLAAKSPDAVKELFNQLVHGGSRAEKLEFLTQADGADLGSGLRVFLTILLEDSEIMVRLKTIEVIASQGEGGAYPKFHRLAQALAKSGGEDREIAAIGKAMVQVNPKLAQEDLARWALPDGFFNKMKGATQGLRRAGVAGLVELKGDQVDAVLRKVATSRDDDVARLARDTLRKRGTLAHPRVQPSEDPT
jgi:hypothetical protein